MCYWLLNTEPREQGVSSAVQHFLVLFPPVPVEEIGTLWFSWQWELLTCWVPASPYCSAIAGCLGGRPQSRPRRQRVLRCDDAVDSHTGAAVYGISANFDQEFDFWLTWPQIRKKMCISLSSSSITQTFLHPQSKHPLNNHFVFQWTVHVVSHINDEKEKKNVYLNIFFFFLNRKKLAFDSEYFLTFSTYSLHNEMPNF